MSAVSADDRWIVELVAVDEAARLREHGQFVWVAYNRCVNWREVAAQIGERRRVFSKIAKA